MFRPKIRVSSTFADILQVARNCTKIIPGASQSMSMNICVPHVNEHINTLNICVLIHKSMLMCNRYCRCSNWGVRSWGFEPSGRPKIWLHGFYLHLKLQGCIHSILKETSQVFSPSSGTGKTPRMSRALPGSLETLSGPRHMLAVSKISKLNDSCTCESTQKVKCWVCSTPLRAV